MIQKISLSKNKYKILSVFLFIIISIILSIYLAFKVYDYEYFISKLENELNLRVEKEGKYKISFFPEILFKQNNLTISKDQNDLKLLARKIEFEAVKKYYNLGKTKFILNSPSTLVNGLNFRDLKIKGSYKNSKIQIENFTSMVDEGELNFFGIVELNKKNSLNIDGDFKNISLTRLLKQTMKVDWQRLVIKLRSNFHIDTYGKNKKEYIMNLNANLPITGLFYINTTQEERFGTALLNVLATQIPELSDISKSLDFLINKYADVPSNIKGLITINKGIFTTNDLIIYNDHAKMKIDLIYNIIEDNINGTLSFYDNEKIFLTTQLKGTIDEPQILIEGKTFIQEKDQIPLNDIKEIIEQGITNIFQNILENND